MTAEPLFWDRVRELFHACAELDPAARRALLDAEEVDDALRGEVESLLAEHDGADGFLDRSVWDLARDAALPATVGTYRVIRRLGEGGMGTVLLAARHDQQYEQLVAIKLVRQAAGGTQLLRRFRQERQILAALAHPNIARLLDGGETADGLPYLVMEYVEGTPVDLYCREKDLPTAARLRLFLALCDAVQYAHRNLIIHRDIKPGNVLVTSDGVPKLLDFGIAKLTSDQTKSDATATRLMTPDYASPEQLDGRIVTTASDVYSLGVLLFELLTGRKPFTGQIRKDAPRPSSMTGAALLRGDLDHILMVALDPDPERRYGSVENFAADIRRHLDGHPVSARGASFTYRAAKFVRRNKFIVGAAAAALLVAIVAFIAVLQQKRIAERRFEQVRSLAHSVVFDIHDAIAPLRGSTAARRLLVQRALVYLDGLAGESSDNTALELELAGAYERIGDVQGMPYRPNLGEGTAALTSYRKARALAERVCNREPRNIAAHALLAELYDRTGLIEQRALQFGIALHDHQTARAIRDALPQRDAARDLAQARTWVAIGDCIYLSSALRPVTPDRSGVRGAYETALKILEGVPRIAAFQRDLLMETGRAHQRLGGYFTGNWEHDPQRALAHHQAATRVLEQRAKLDPTDAVSRRNYADQLLMTATLQNRTGDAQAAIAGTTTALGTLRELATGDADNVEAQHDLAFAYEQLGTANSILGRFDDAERAFNETLRIRQRLFAADPTNREEHRGIYSTYAALASLEKHRGNIALEAEYRKKANTIYAELKK
jgi:non-specific serine/threonine protein kinase/serine/threonine-protein kinase